VTAPVSSTDFPFYRVDLTSADGGIRHDRLALRGTAAEANDKVRKVTT